MSGAGQRRVALSDPRRAVPAAVLAACAAACGPGRAVVGVRPVTDTLKQVQDGRLVGTLDRDEVLEVAGPLVADGPAAAVLTHDCTLPEAVAALAAAGLLDPWTLEAGLIGDDGPDGQDGSADVAGDPGPRAGVTEL